MDTNIRNAILEGLNMKPDAEAIAFFGLIFDQSRISPRNENLERTLVTAAGSISQTMNCSLEPPEQISFPIGSKIWEAPG